MMKPVSFRAMKTMVATLLVLVCGLFALAGCGSSGSSHDNGAEGASAAASGAGSGDASGFKELASTDTNGLPQAIAMSPDGKRLYAVGVMGTPVMEFAIQDGGKLGNLGSVPAPNSAMHIKADPRGRYVYAEGIDRNGAILSSYAMAGNGALAPVGSVIVPGAENRGFAVSSDGKFLFTANGGNATVSVIGVGDDGSLKTLSTTKVDAPAGIWHVEYSNGFVYMGSPCSAFVGAGVCHGGGEVFTYGVNPDGTLTQASRATLQMQVGALAVDTRGHFAYVSGVVSDGADSGTYGITPLSVDGHGKLTALPLMKTEGEMVSLLVDPQSKHLYASHDFNVDFFAIADDGSLAAKGSVKLSGSPSDMAIDPKGRMLYTGNFMQHTISTVEVSE
jgi:6-phosphogluconolactonase (cycloisomerase 2 family)